MARHGVCVFIEPPTDAPDSVVDQVQSQTRSAETSSGMPAADGAGRGEALNRQRLRETAKRICKGLGSPDRNRCELHTFRHTFASACAQNDVPYCVALEWRGHHSFCILDLHMEVFDTAAIEQMPSLDIGGRAEGEF